MADLFVDTSGWGCLVDPSQTHHRTAAALYRNARQQKRKIVTTNYVIAELIVLLASPLRIPRTSAIAFITGLKTSPYVEIIHIDQDLDDQAWQLLASRADKAWSLVDCSSFIVMKHRKIIEALTTDRHFEQAGFLRLLKS